MDFWPKDKIRFFAGHNLPSIDDKALIEKSYENGVSMGADLFADPEQPRRLSLGLPKSKQCPFTATTNIKGWVEDNQILKIYDVACADNMEIDSTKPMRR
ncbi:MAG: hypothetical protein Ct9H90mP25_0990 [Gammaproteobacteria bacterium]|nr:MAG: hypothetical protein Ct9H90mP25_0990 [Gammaproteobacteria bacterium]